MHKWLKIWFAPSVYSLADYRVNNASRDRWTHAQKHFKEYSILCESAKD